MISAVKRRMKETANLGHISHEAALEFERVESVKVSALKERTKTAVQE
jgi:hypothetical protein